MWWSYVTVTIGLSDLRKGAFEMVKLPVKLMFFFVFACRRWGVLSYSGSIILFLSKVE